jgi:adenine-specific DNA glycosylase
MRLFGQIQQSGEISFSKRIRLEEYDPNKPSCNVCISDDHLDIEDGFDVTRYPKKQKKKLSRECRYIACILFRINPSTNHTEVLLWKQNGDDTESLFSIKNSKRRSKGNNKDASMPTGLASLWQIPHELMEQDISSDKNSLKIHQFLKTRFVIPELESIKVAHVGYLNHKLSHISQTFEIWQVELNFPLCALSSLNFHHSYRWIAEQELENIERSTPVSTGSLKIFTLWKDSMSKRNLYSYFSRSTDSCKISGKLDDQNIM